MALLEHEVEHELSPGEAVAIGRNGMAAALPGGGTAKARRRDGLHRRQLGAHETGQQLSMMTSRVRSIPLPGPLEWVTESDPWRQYQRLASAEDRAAYGAALRTDRVAAQPQRWEHTRALGQDPEPEPKRRRSDSWQEPDIQHLEAPRSATRPNSSTGDGMDIIDPEAAPGTYIEPEGGYLVAGGEAYEVEEEDPQTHGRAAGVRHMLAALEEADELTRLDLLTRDEAYALAMSMEWLGYYYGGGVGVSEGVGAAIAAGLARPQTGQVSRGKRDRARAKLRGQKLTSECQESA